MGARAIINAVYGFSQSFPPESWRVLSPTRTDCQGSSLALLATASTGTSVRPLRDAALRGRALLLRRPRRCGTSHHAGAGCQQGRRHCQDRQDRQHHPGGENRNRHGRLGPETVGPTHRAHTTLRSPLTLRLERAYCRPAALPCSGPVVHERRRPGIHTTLRLAVVANPEVSLSAAPSPLTPRSPTAQPSLFSPTAIARFALALNCAALWPSCFPSSLPPLPSPSGPAALFVALCASPSPVHGVAPRRNRSPFPTRGMASAGADCDVRGLTRD